MARKMKDSGIAWIGEIPEEWEISKMKYLIKVSSGEYISKELYSTDGEYPIVGSNGEIGRSYKCNVKDKVITTGRVGSVGTTYLIENAWVSDNALIIRNSLDIDQIYLKQVIPCFDFKNILSGTAQPLITASALKNQYIPFPPLDEQRRIAAFLDEKCAHIDAVIEKTRASIDDYKKLKQAIITRAVTKGLRQGRKMKDSGCAFVHGIPEAWQNQKLLSILSMRIIDGFHESPELIDEGVPYVSATAIENGIINFDKIRGYISERYSDLCDKRYKPQMNDILMIKLGATTGAVARIKTEQRFNIWVPLAAIRCNSVTNPDFVFFALQADYAQRQIQLSWTYGTQQTLGVKTIEGLRILLPPLPEQKEIAVYLDAKTAAIDRLIAKKEQLIAEMQSCKKSLIYEVVTGKREVAI